MPTIRGLIPQRWRLRLWLVSERLTPGAFRLRRAQPSFRQRLVAHVVLVLRIRRKRPGPRGLARVDGVRVINLRSRADRLARTTAELQRLGIVAERFDAIEHENGALGCALSHAACLSEMAERRWESMLVCEDDVEFLVDRRRLDVLVDELLDDPRVDVACLAYFVWASRPYSRLFLRAGSVQTTACYLVKRSVATELRAVWSDGIEQLRRGGPSGLYACDRSWMQLQEQRVFLVPIVRAARQRRGYSEIQRRDVAYAG